MLVSYTGEDNAESFFNSTINEAYHSKIGPTIEAKHKFVEPSCIKYLLLENKDVKVLDLFFGLGYNTGIALKFAYEITSFPKLEITAIENDPIIINKIKELKVPAWYIKWQEVLSRLQEKNIIKFDNISLNLHLECVYDVLKKLPKQSFDVIFFDPFSHKTAPEFWTNDFLASVFELLKPGGTLTTYSGLKRVEQLASNTGYIVERIQPIGRKKSSLLIKQCNEVI